MVFFADGKAHVCPVDKSKAKQILEDGLASCQDDDAPEALVFDLDEVLSTLKKNVPAINALLAGNTVDPHDVIDESYRKANGPTESQDDAGARL